MIIEVDDYRAMADYINTSIVAISYHHFDNKTIDILARIACIIRPFTNEEFDNERELIEGSEADSLVGRLIDAISTRSVESTIKNLLVEYEQFEILQHIDF